MPYNSKPSQGSRIIKMMLISLLRRGIEGWTHFVRLPQVEVIWREIDSAWCPWIDDQLVEGLVDVICAPHSVRRPARHQGTSAKNSQAIGLLDGEVRPNEMPLTCGEWNHRGSTREKLAKKTISRR